MVVGQRSQAGDQPAAEDAGILLEALLLDHLEDGETGRRNERVAAERVDVEILRQRGGDLRSRHDGGQGQAVADALGHRHDLGRNTGALEAPVVVSGAGEAGLHLVGDADAAVGADDVVDLRQVVRRSHRDTAGALNGLRDEGGDLARGGVADQLRDILGALACDLLRRAGERVAIGIGVDRVVDGAAALGPGLPGVKCCQGAGRCAAAVVGVADADDVGVTGVQPGHLDRQIVRLAAAVDEIDAVELGRQLGQQGLGEARHVRMQERRRAVGQERHLLLNRRDDLRVRVAAGDGADAREQIEVAPAAVVPDVLALAFDQHYGFAVQGKERRIHVLPAQGEGLLAGGPRVGSRAVAAGRQLQGSGSRRGRDVKCHGHGCSSSAARS